MSWLVITYIACQIFIFILICKDLVHDYYNDGIRVSLGDIILYVIVMLAAPLFAIIATAAYLEQNSDKPVIQTKRKEKK